jgi:transposase
MRRSASGQSVSPAPIVGGVDTHKDTHTAAALSATGQVLGTQSFPTTRAGYRALLRWLQGHGAVQAVGVEGTGSYGAGLSRFLQAEQVLVQEVLRPNRQQRRRQGKSDPVDAVAAARAVLAGEAAGPPKGQDGLAECLRLLRLARRSASKARTQAANQLHALRETAPEELRAVLRGLAVPHLAARAGRFRSTVPSSPLAAARYSLKLVAQRWSALSREIQQVDREIAALVQALAPELLAVSGVGPETAATLLVAAGDSPERLRSEAGFAALCGVSPVEASSGRQQRHRLNRGGNREANRALWVVALSRLRHDARTQAYRARRTAQGLSPKEILRCLKRYLARELYPLLLTALRRQQSRGASHAA